MKWAYFHPETALMDHVVGSEAVVVVVIVVEKSEKPAITITTNDNDNDNDNDKNIICQTVPGWTLFNFRPEMRIFVRGQGARKAKKRSVHMGT
jgi:hypothetical protein